MSTKTPASPALRFATALAAAAEAAAVSDVTGYDAACVELLDADEILKLAGLAFEITVQEGGFAVDGAAVDALVDIRNPGMRHGPAEVLARVAAGEDVDPSLYYFRTTPRFTTGHPALGWMNRTLFVARGRRLAARVEIEVFAVG